MPYTLLLHLANDEPVVVETEDLPGPNDTWLRGVNPRRKDNKDLRLEEGVTTVIYPTWRINFIEVMPGEDEEQIITTVRDNRTYGH